MGHRHGARLAQEFGDKTRSLRLAALLTPFDRHGLGRSRLPIDAVLLNARAFRFLIVIVRLSIEQPGQRELVMLLLIDSATGRLLS